MTREAATFRWPDRACFGAFLLYGVLLCILWVVIYGGASWLTGLHGYRVRLDTVADAGIPFVPEASVVYLSLFPMIWLSLFILPTPYEIRKFAKALAWLYVVSGIGFILLPAEQIHSTPPIQGPIRPVFEFADWINLDYNFLPSLHVGMAIVCACAYAGQLHWTAAVLFWTWTAAISVSTLVTHEHYLADVLAGALVGFVVAAICFRNADAEDGERPR
ncbi:MAG: phosphatase PAP2 family protein [Pirellulales bacterium]|nr:phosphatase PAP2 family protein [Pirellulales bacterium]